MPFGKTTLYKASFAQPPALHYHPVVFFPVQTSRRSTDTKIICKCWMRWNNAPIVNFVAGPKNKTRPSPNFCKKEQTGMDDYEIVNRPRPLATQAVGSRSLQAQNFGVPRTGSHPWTKKLRMVHLVQTGIHWVTYWGPVLQRILLLRKNQIDGGKMSLFKKR